MTRFLDTKCAIPTFVDGRTIPCHLKMTGIAGSLALGDVAMLQTVSKRNKNAKINVVLIS